MTVAPFSTLVLVSGLLHGALFLQEQSAKSAAELRPMFQYHESGGCGNLVVYSVNKTNTELLVVRIRLDAKTLPTAARQLVIDLARPPVGVEVRVLVHRTDNHEFPCSDIGGISWWEVPTRWVPSRGTIIIVAKPPKVGVGEYPVTVRVIGAHFLGPSGEVAGPLSYEIKTIGGGVVGG